LISAAISAVAMATKIGYITTTFVAHLHTLVEVDDIRIAQRMHPGRPAHRQSDHNADHAKSGSWP
jgi:predicted ArsR family transcriptional regulator